jgi:hypothetical protein
VLISVVMDYACCCSHFELNPISDVTWVNNFSTLWANTRSVRKKKYVHTYVQGKKLVKPFHIVLSRRGKNNPHFSKKKNSKLIENMLFCLFYGD